METSRIIKAYLKGFLTCHQTCLNMSPTKFHQLYLCIYIYQDNISATLISFRPGKVRRKDRSQEVWYQKSSAFTTAQIKPWTVVDGLLMPYHGYGSCLSLIPLDLHIDLIWAAFTLGPHEKRVDACNPNFGTNELHVLTNCSLLTTGFSHFRI